MSMNKYLIIRLATYSELLYVIISLAKLKGYVMVTSLWVRGTSIIVKTIAILHPGIFIADKICENFSKLLTAGLWVLGLPWSIPGLDFFMQILSCSSLVILSLFSKLLKAV